jgi:hypothetical protein
LVSKKIGFKNSIILLTLFWLESRDKTRKQNAEKNQGIATDHSALLRFIIWQASLPVKWRTVIG